MELAHPLGVEPGQVVVDRDDVGAVAGEAVEVDRQRGHEGLALAGLHLGDPAEVQGGPADHLHVVVALADDPLGGLPDDGEGLDEQLVELLAVVETLAELHRLRLQRASSSSASNSGSSALMSGTRLWSALSFFPSPERRILSKMAMRGASLPTRPPSTPSGPADYSSSRIFSRTA